VGGCDEDDLYAAMDYLHARQDKIEGALAARHLARGVLVLYDVSSAAFEGRTCPLGAIGHPKDGVHGRLQIVYGLLTSPEGIPVAIEVFAGNTGDPATVAAQVTRVKDRFEIGRVVLVGDRGMLTAARLREDVGPAGLDWITALRTPQARKLVRGGDLQLTLFDAQDLAEISSPDFPGERLVACKNPFLEAERARKRESLLAATEADLGKIAAACARARAPLRGQGKIAVRVDRVLGRAQGRQALPGRYRQGPAQLPPRPGLDHRRSFPGRHLRAAHQCRAQRPGRRGGRFLLQGPSPGRACLPRLQY